MSTWRSAAPLTQQPASVQEDLQKSFTQRALCRPKHLTTLSKKMLVGEQGPIIVTSHRLHLFLWREKLVIEKTQEEEKKLTVIPLPSSLVKLEKMVSDISMDPASLSILTALPWRLTFLWLSHGDLPSRAAPVNTHPVILTKLFGWLASWMSTANGTCLESRVT